MEVVIPIWKSNLVSQLKQDKCKQNSYANVIEHCMFR